MSFDVKTIADICSGRPYTDSCIEAVAAWQGSVINAHATVELAWFTLSAGALAVAAAALGAWAVYQSARKSSLALEKRARAERRRVCVTYLAEIAALSEFLKKKLVIDKLQAKSKKKERFFFHPGDDWLKTFSSDPTSIGHFESELAADLVYYICRMLNEIGRLKWLHNLGENELKALTPDGLAREMENSVEILEVLGIEETKIQSAISSYKQTLDDEELGPAWWRKLD